MWKEPAQKNLPPHFSLHVLFQVTSIKIHSHLFFLQSEKVLGKSNNTNSLALPPAVLHNLRVFKFCTEYTCYHDDKKAKECKYYMYSTERALQTQSVFYHPVLEFTKWEKAQIISYTTKKNLWISHQKPLTMKWKSMHTCICRHLSLSSIWTLFFPVITDKTLHCKKEGISKANHLMHFCLEAEREKAT